MVFCLTDSEPTPTEHFVLSDNGCLCVCVCFTDLPHTVILYVNLSVWGWCTESEGTEREVCKGICYHGCAMLTTGRVDVTSGLSAQPGVNVHKNHSTERRHAQSLRQQQPVTRCFISLFASLLCPCFFIFILLCVYFVCTQKDIWKNV